MTQVGTGTARGDRLLLGAGLALAAAGAVVAVLLAVSVPVLGLVLLVPVLLAAVCCGAGVLLRRRSVPDALVLLRDAVAGFLAVGVLGLVLGLTVFDRTGVTYLGSVVVQHGTVLLAGCEQGAPVGLRGFGPAAACRGTATWTGGDRRPEQVVLRDSRLDAADVGHTVPVVRERLLTGNELVSSGDGHPWTVAGLLLGTPLVLLAIWLAALTPAAATGQGRLAPLRGLRGLRERGGGEPARRAALRAEHQVRASRGRAGFARARAVPGWVVTGDLRRLRLAGLVLLATGVVTHLVRGGPPELPGRAGLGGTIGALGGLLLVVAVYRVERRRRDAARIGQFGPDDADALESVRERSRRPHDPVTTWLAVLLGAAGLLSLRPVVLAVIGTASGDDTTALAVPAVGLLAAGGLLLVAASEDDRGWRGLVCSAGHTPVPAVPGPLRAALSGRELATLDGRFPDTTSSAPAGDG